MTTPYVDPQIVHDPSTGAAPPAAWGDAVRDGLEFLARRPGVVCAWTGSQSVPSGPSSFDLSFAGGQDIRDTDGFHSSTEDPERFTVPSGLGGWYRIVGAARIQANGAGYRDIRIRVNGASASETSLVRRPAIAGTDIFFQVTEMVHLNGGDYVTLAVAQTSGTTLAVTRARLEMTLEVLD